MFVPMTNCPDCGTVPCQAHTVKLLPNQPVNIAPDLTPMITFGMSGWICSVCHGGVSPFVTRCPCKPSFSGFLGISS